MPDFSITGVAVIFLAAILTNNILLSKFLGMCSFIAIWDAPLCAVDLTYLTFLVLIMVIAGFVQLVEMVIERFSPLLYYNLGIFLPLITVNCAILGVNLLMIDPDRNFHLVQTAAYALGSGLGWLLAICLMAGLRRRLAHADIPRPLQGLGIILIITGLMAMAFMGFAGVADL